MDSISLNRTCGVHGNQYDNSSGAADTGNGLSLSDFLLHSSALRATAEINGHLVAVCIWINTNRLYQAIRELRAK